MYAGKSIIGLLGGIGSGKSFIASLFGELGCRVIQSDKLVERAYNQGDVRRQLIARWGLQVVHPDGQVNRAALAAIVFSDDAARKELEAIVHPLVDRFRQEQMADAAGEDFPAFVWDTPLLMENGLERQCDARVFVQAPVLLREKRVMEKRGWDKDELNRREKLQLPLDRKRKISEYVIDNTADAVYAREQVQDVLSRIRG